ncbi:FMN-dependent NADH-azoreductase [Flavobacterium resistens]|uniref:FMN dependent NADH:quinone oxidoreductase n=1 Tax=Flavobacterium resistens TaxID=443612 RepID=A0A521FB05_9FLAO|nr:NAD(P)H-dependent oxidoreductase [Flavobacterium resistens]MRX70504.1 NAD(P)H dehydrogenase [Flavobacterium resistens]SMO93326.1 FMN-dependent NADH-azoreductase [Flavobacterium resistens]
MKKILVINSSPRDGRSRSRKLANTFVEIWKKQAPDTSITYRDLASTNVPHVSETWIAAAFRLENDRTETEIEALKLSKELISELKEADVIVLAAPMYNWTITSSLKAYIDQVLRVNETWKLNTEDLSNPYIGLLKNKTLFLLTSRGAQGYEKGEYNEHMNFQTPYLKMVFNIIGITDIQEITVDGEVYGPEAIELAIEKSNAKVTSLIERYFYSH